MGLAWTAVHLGLAQTYLQIQHHQAMVRTQPPPEILEAETARCPVVGL